MRVRSPNLLHLFIHRACDFSRSARVFLASPSWFWMVVTEAFASALLQKMKLYIVIYQSHGNFTLADIMGYMYKDLKI